MFFRSDKYRKEAERLLSLLNVKSGSIIADVGAGKGNFAKVMIKIINPNIKIFAVEADPDRLTKINEKIERGELANTTAIQSSDDSLNLSPLSCAAAFTRYVYHHFSKPEKINASLFIAIKPGGRLVVIDFTPKFFLSLFSRVKNIPKNRGGHGIAKELVIQELEAAGFRLIEQIDKWTRGKYCLVFEKPR